MILGQQSPMKQTPARGKAGNITQGTGETELPLTLSISSSKSRAHRITNAG